MNKQFKITILFLSIITILVSACTSTTVDTSPAENTAQIVITETYTPIPVSTTKPADLPTATPSHTPTATSTPNPTSTPTSTSTSTALPTETPDLSKFGFEEYVHPSGKFKLEIASRDTQVIEFEDAVFFTDGFHFIMAGFTLQEHPLDEENWISVTKSFLDQFLIEWSAITSYDRLERQESQNKNSYNISFNYFSEGPIQEGRGEILFIQQAETLYGLVLLTPEYHDVEFVWEIVKNSFMPIEEQ
jgi:hypothetical protein